MLKVFERGYYVEKVKPLVAEKSKFGHSALPQSHACTCLDEYARVTCKCVYGSGQLFMGPIFSLGFANEGKAELPVRNSGITRQRRSGKVRVRFACARSNLVVFGSTLIREPKDMRYSKILSSSFVEILANIKLPQPLLVGRGPIGIMRAHGSIRSERSPGLILRVLYAASQEHGVKNPPR